MTNNLLCPECGNESLHKSGKTASGRRYKQRYLCNTCLRTTIAPIDKVTGKQVCTTIELNRNVVPIAQAEGLHNETDA
jgi:transposase-like protein